MKTVNKDIIVAKYAKISSCGQYRYTLFRRWSTDPIRRVLFVMYNPSTADADLDDPTIRRCIGFAKRFGYNAMEVVNLYAYRSTDPKKLLEVSDPFGPCNYNEVNFAAQEANLVICAWGNNKILNNTDKKIIELLRVHHPTLYCLKQNKDGSPAHPLYLSSQSELIQF